MKILVCGGRDFDDYEYIKETLEMIHAEHEITCLVHGAATGTDSLAAAWAEEKGIELVPYPADFEKFGRAAGPIRNSQMLKENIELVIAFPGGAGTMDMIKKARRQGKHILRM